MIYVEFDPCYVDGNAIFYRAYADTSKELVSLFAKHKIMGRVYEAGRPNEHTILSDENLAKIGDFRQIDERAKVKLFKAKASGPTPKEYGTVKETEAAGVFDPEFTPGMTDLMVAPETIDAALEADPLPEPDLPSEKLPKKAGRKLPGPVYRGKSKRAGTVAADDDY